MSTALATVRPAEIESWDDHIEAWHLVLRNANDCYWALGQIVSSLKGRYGESAIPKFAEEVGSTGSSVWRYAQVWETFPENSQRCENLSWAHHLLAASRPDPQAAIQLAANEGLSVRAFRAALATQATATLAPPEAGSYRTLVADPPWQYSNTATRGSAEDHYPTMTLDAIKAMRVPVEWAADDAHLYLWVTNNFIREGFEVVEAWGFEYRTCLTWVKPQIGMGNYFRSRTEHVLFAIKGRLPTAERDVSNVIDAPRTQHSRKPDVFYDLVERMSPEPRLELFARRRRLGWDVWGAEA